MVEYAGDFVAQNPATGQVTNVYTNANGTDGQIDYILTHDANGNVARKIRWYGFPRDTDGIAGTSPNQYNTGAPDNQIYIAKSSTAAEENLMADVVPLRDVWRTATTPGASPYATNAPFEKFTWTQDPTSNYSDAGAPPPTPLLADPGKSGTGGNYMDPSSGVQANDSYICAWGPNDPKPKMIRIIITLDDPTGKLPDGQTFEYVFTLP